MDSISAEKEDGASICRHYWVIESPRGPVSTGVCRVCSERREFRNSFANTGWERESMRNKRSRQQT